MARIRVQRNMEWRRCRCGEAFRAEADAPDYAEPRCPKCITRDQDKHRFRENAFLADCANGRKLKFHFAVDFGLACSVVVEFAGETEEFERGTAAWNAAVARLGERETREQLAGAFWTEAGREARPDEIRLR
jgi:hypothetical protein